MMLDPPSPPASLRLWPGIVIAVVVALARFVIPIFAPDAAGIGVLSGVVGLLLIIIWWLFFSQAPWPDRLGALVLMGLGMAVTFPFLHESIATGMMGLMFFIYAIPPILTIAFVGWAVAARHLRSLPRRASMAVVILLACGAWTLLRTDGLIGGRAQLAWRWTPTAEERLLAHADHTPAVVRHAPPVTTVLRDPTEPARPTPSPEPAGVVLDPRTAERAAAVTAEPGAAARKGGNWPGFRGPKRDGVVRGLRIETDWSRTPPVELWRQPVGPGWSSFAVDGSLFYTQEQRGEHEVVSAYRLATGEPVWRHRDAIRFYESNGGAGPRATPTIHGGRVYALGATGILNALDAATGAVVWSRDAQADTGAPLPGWGFAGSPLVVGDAVIVATSGRLIAYELATGTPRWTHSTGGGGYSSPHLVTVDDVPQILLLSGGGVTSVSPADGAVLWQHGGGGDTSIVQPALAANGDVLLAAGDMMGGTGIRRIALTHGTDGWMPAERWTTRGLKPYFNDFVVHDGHAYGFDGSILSCISLEDGARTWKGGRYGQGQLVLLADSDVLLVLSEEGELALVRAAPDRHTELARMPALNNKTWNHPSVVGDLLLIRNGEEMAAYRLPVSRH
jgi:outer membrane protein assembly factor BamB